MVIVGLTSQLSDDDNQHEDISNLNKKSHSSCMIQNLNIMIPRLEVSEL